MASVARVARATRVPSLEKIRLSDGSWVQLMNNKELTADLMDFLIKEADVYNEGDSGFVYGGRCIFGESGSHVEEAGLIDEFTLDLVDPVIRRKEPATKKTGTRNTQGLYPSIGQWLKDHKPDEYRNTIYFVGDAHYGGQDEETKEHTVDIHWNCFIVVPRKRELVIYDPTAESTSIERGYVYDFNTEKVDRFLDALQDLGGYFTQYTLSRILPEKRAQIYCDWMDTACDIFCQSWVMCFASAYMCGEEVCRKFLSLDFSLNQTIPLKAWLQCVFSTKEMEGWRPSYEKPELKLFRSYIRGKIVNSEDVIAVGYPRVYPEPERKKGVSKVPCIVSIVQGFEGSRS